MSPSRKHKTFSPADLILALKRSLSNQALDVFKSIVEQAAAQSLSLYVVGGTVRDLILRTPTKDLDLVVEGDAISLASSVAASHGIRPTTHHAFGTATIKADPFRIDLATARKETYPRPGALPTVSPSSIDDDLRRRDFTFNAMALGLTGPDRSRLLDPHHGMSDLQQGLVRILHDASFRDDATRMFRAVRYEQRLGFQIEPHTASLLKEALGQKMISTISSDRLRHEMEIMLKEASPGKALRQSQDLGLLQALFPPLGRAPSLSLLPDDSEPLVFIAALAHHLTPSEVEAFITRLNMTHSWAVTIRQSVDLRSVESELSEPDLTRLALWQILEYRPLECIKAAAILAESPLAKERLQQYINLYQSMRPLLTGDDLLALGCPPGPEVGHLLRQLQTARLEGYANTKDDEVKLVRQWLAS
jgi:tRNA nucleotidyltransferase (CCA-adding enzyme)